MPIRMIVTDLDQTLLKSDKSISVFTLEVLSRCRAKGILLAVATARSETAARKYLQMLQPDLLISNGGALASRKDASSRGLLYKRTLPPETANGLIQSCLCAQGVGFVIAEMEDGYYVNYPDDPVHPARDDYRHAVYTDFSKPFACGLLKATVQFTNEETPAGGTPARIAEKFSDTSVLGFSGETWYRFAHKEAGKWEALSASAKAMSIPVTEIAAFGDDFNDLAMLKNCGFGVAVANAVPEVLAAADAVCPSNDDDGVGCWLLENAL